MKELDEKDKLILNMLRENARASYSEIAERVKLSRVAVKNRVLDLENQGVIKGYHASVSTGNTTEVIPFYAEIMTDANSFQEITNELVADNRVVNLCNVTSGCTLFAVCIVKNLCDVETFLQQYRDRNGVVRIYIYNILGIKKGSIL